MKKLSWVIFIASLAVLSCHKKKINDKLSLIGSYSGRSEVRSSQLQEIFTSPGVSHFEWLSDSVFIDPDELIVQNLSVDSLELSGPVAMQWPDYWRRIAWEEVQNTDTAFVLMKYLSSPGYFSEDLKVVFSSDGQFVSANYHHTDTYSDKTVKFNGSK